LVGGYGGGAVFDFDEAVFAIPDEGGVCSCHDGEGVGGGIAVCIIGGRDAHAPLDDGGVLIQTIGCVVRGGG